MSRAVWKGAISFGLVHIPITLYAASRDTALDFDWLDERDLAPVGYRRINKRTQQTIEAEHIVKGYQYEPGEYVLMTDEDFKQANVKATQTIEIMQFVEVGAISPPYFSTPYYLEADKGGDKGYALLREVLRRTGQAGLATVVIHTKQHLAALLVQGDLLLLNTMRFSEQLIPPNDFDELNIPHNDLKTVGVRAGELAIAEQLVTEMSAAFEPQRYRDTYRDDLLARINARIEAGQTHSLTPATEDAPAQGAQIIDLMEALKQSLRAGERRPAAKTSKTASKSAAGSSSKSTTSLPLEKRAARQPKEARGTNANAASSASAKPSAARYTRGGSRSANGSPGGSGGNSVKNSTASDLRPRKRA